MKRLFLLGLLFPLFCCLNAQPQIIERATDFIKQNQFAQANRYLDSVLKKHPRTVDALMMKGNVLLNSAWQHNTTGYYNIDKAELPTDTGTFSRMGFYVPIIPVDTARAIEKIWLQCLRIDSTRNDIRKGLCNLYSISLMVPELKSLLLQMKPYILQSEENAFLFADYARNVKARGRFDEGMGIYQLIADMFPALAGIRCDMAGEYFYNGKPNDALRYLDSAMSKKNVDQTTFINAAGIYSSLGYYDNALETFSRYSRENKLVVDIFYKALMMFANADSNFFTRMSSFLTVATEQNYYDEVHLAQKLLPYGKTSFTPDDYRALLNGMNIPDYYKVLIHQRAMTHFADVCEPYMNYGTFQMGLYNNTIAMAYLNDHNLCQEDTALNETRKLYVGYMIYKAGEHEVALSYFYQLSNSRNLFTQQAAKYFIAKIYAFRYRTVEAKQLFEEIKTAKPQTKYGWLAAYLLDQFK